MPIKIKPTPVLTGDQKNNFWSKVAVGGRDECWLWLGCKLRTGYGRVNINNQVHLAHRIAFSLNSGNVEVEGEIAHSCDNPPCCNPNHGFLTDHAGNVRDMDRKGRRVITRGESVNTTKLSETQVKSIRLEYRRGNGAELGRKYGVTGGSIGRIAARKTWRHL